MGLASVILSIGAYSLRGGASKGQGYAALMSGIFWSCATGRTSYAPTSSLISGPLGETVLASQKEKLTVIHNLISSGGWQ